MNILNQKKAAAILSFVILIVPAIASGITLIPCENKVVAGKVTDSCGFDDIMKLANNIVRFLMIDIVMPLIAIGFMYIGARLILYQNKKAEWDAAKGSFENLAIGFGYILGFYVLVKFVLSQFLKEDFTTFLFQ